MLLASPVASAEEWTIHDYEGFEGVHLSESAGFEQVTELAAFIFRHGKLGAELIGHFGGIEEARKVMDDRYHGAFASLADYVQELTEETTVIPEVLRFYIDWQAMVRDAEMSGDVLAIAIAHDEVHVFAGH